MSAFPVEKFSLLALKANDGVGQEIADINCGAATFHFGMFLAQQPADVSEEESALGIVRIRIRLTELVVHSMIARPLVYVILQPVDLHIHIPFHVTSKNQEKNYWPERQQFER